MVIAKVTKVTVLTEVVLVMEFQREKELAMGTPNKLDELVVLSEDAGLVKIILFLARMCLVEMVPKVEVIEVILVPNIAKLELLTKITLSFVCILSLVGVKKYNWLANSQLVEIMW